MVESLEPRTLLAAPIGSFDYAGRDVISGWAFDPDNGSGAVNVRITAGGKNFDVVANQNRPDLQGPLGSANHGFVFNTPLTLAGNQTVTISALDATTGQYVAIGQKTLPNATPAGALDVATNTTISGWAYDPEANNGTARVRIVNNGNTLTTIDANTTRDDLTPFFGTANHGFSLAGNFGVVDVYAIDTPTGNATLLGTNNRVSFGSLDYADRTRVSGWVFDPDRAGQSVRVRVVIDGQTYTEVTADKSRPDLQAGLGGSNYGFDIPIVLPPGPHSIQVFAVESDTTSVDQTLLGEIAGLTNPSPLGVLDVAGREGVSGWAFDPDAGANPVQIQVRVDGQVKATVTANSQRNDLGPVIGSTNHGFFVPLSGLAAGPHKIEIYALDNPSNTPVKIAQQFIDNTLPIGAFDIVTPTLIAGWAFDPDANSGPVSVIYELNGTRYTPVVANQLRNDLTFTPTRLHGFSSNTPTHLFGQNTVRVIAVDTFTDEEVVLGQKTFTNRAPIGSVDVVSANRVAGWAYDWDNNGQPIEILLRLDGQIVDRRTANTNRPDLQSGLGSSNHGFDISISGLGSGEHFFEVFGVDPATGLTQLIGSRRITV